MRGIVAWSVLGGLETRNGETVPVYSVGMKFHSTLADGGEDLLAPVADPSPSSSGWPACASTSTDKLRSTTRCATPSASSATTACSSRSTTR